MGVFMDEFEVKCSKLLDSVFLTLSKNKIVSKVILAIGEELESSHHNLSFTHDNPSRMNKTGDRIRNLIS